MIAKFRGVLYCIGILVLESESHEPAYMCSECCSSSLFHWRCPIRYFYSHSETTSFVFVDRWSKSEYVYYSVVFYVFSLSMSDSITFRIRFGIFAETIHQ